MSSVLQALLGAPRDWCTLTYDRQEAVTFSSVNKHVILWSSLLSLFFIKDQNKQLSCIVSYPGSARQSLGVSAYRMTRVRARESSGAIPSTVTTPHAGPRGCRRRRYIAGYGCPRGRGAAQVSRAVLCSQCKSLVGQFHGHSAMAWRAACAHRRHARQRDRGSFCAFILAASPPF